MKKIIHILQFHFKRTKAYGLRSLFFYLRFRWNGSKMEGIRLAGLQHALRLSNTGPDLTTLFQIFFAEEYTMPFDLKAKTIIDCGANIGLSAVYYANRYPDAKIFAIEPDRSNYQVLVENTRHYKNVVCLNKAIWSHRQQIQLVDIGTGN